MRKRDLHQLNKSRWRSPYATTLVAGQRFGRTVAFEEVVEADHVTADVADWDEVAEFVGDKMELMVGGYL